MVMLEDRSAGMQTNRGLRRHSLKAVLGALATGLAVVFAIFWVAIIAKSYMDEGGYAAAQQAKVERAYGITLNQYVPASPDSRGSAVIQTATCQAKVNVSSVQDGNRLYVDFEAYTTYFTPESLQTYLARCAQGLAPAQP